MRKRLLLWTTLLLMLVGFSAALTPFARAFNPNARSRDNATILVDLPPLKTGELQRLQVNGRPLLILRPSAEQWQSIRQMDSHVWDKRMSSWNQELGAFLYWGISTRLGALVVEKPAGQSTLTEFWADSKPAPVWLGGYWDPMYDSCYDYAGRTIHDAEYTYNGFNMNVPNLTPAHVELLGANKLAVLFYDKKRWTDSTL